jgi:hypothetical protein
MKLLIIFCLAFNGLFASPIDFKEGTPMTDVLKSQPDFHFKFYKTVHEKPFSKMTFGMIGYWKDGKGYVLQFTSDKLVCTTEFTSLKEYTEWITNPEEKRNIVINDLTLN